LLSGAQSRNENTILDTGIEYGQNRMHERCAKNYRRSARKAVGESATSEWDGYYANCARGIAACRGFTNVYAIAGATRENQVFADGGGAEGRSMIAADTSTWVAFLEGETATDTELLDQALRDRQVLMVPVVLTELLSDPKLPVEVARTLGDLPPIEIERDYWQRAGALRAKVLAKRRRARLADALIAQSCVDRGISLLTRDRDFRAFSEAAGLQLIV
jgi:predicted nucleic acid-binding protein